MPRCACLNWNIWIICNRRLSRKVRSRSPYRNERQPGLGAILCFYPGWLRGWSRHILHNLRKFRKRRALWGGLTSLSWWIRKMYTALSRNIWTGQTCCVSRRTPNYYRHFQGKTILKQKTCWKRRSVPIFWAMLKEDKANVWLQTASAVFHIENTIAMLNKNGFHYGVGRAY